MSESNFLIDLQEQRRFAEAAERFRDLNVRFDQLRAGDILISGERGCVLIERKSISDLAGSIESGQLFKELDQMYSETKGYPDVKRFLLVEGSPITLLEKRVQWSLTSLLSGMVSVAVGWNISLIWITEKTLTVSFVLAIASFLGKPRGPPQIYGSRPKRKRRSLQERQRFFLEGVSGIGGKTADKILKAHGSIWFTLKPILEGHEDQVPELNRSQLKELKELVFSDYNQGGKKIES